MIRLTIFFISAFYCFIPAVAAITVDKTVLNVQKRAMPAIWADRAYYPVKTVVNIGGSPGSWTYVISGGLATACGTPCFKLDGQHDFITTSSPSTGNLTLAIDWTNLGEDQLAIGTYTGTVTFTETGTGLTASISISLVELPATDVTAQGEVKATSNGPNTSCTLMTLPVNGQSYSGVCPIPNSAPDVSVPSVTRPAVNGFFTDPVFGGVFHRITDADCATEYGTLTPYSKDSTYILTSCGIWNNFTGALLRPSTDYPLQSGIVKDVMSPLDDHILYFYSGSGVYSWNFFTNASPVLLADYSASPYSAGILQTGGTADIGEEGWYVVYDGGVLSATALTPALGSHTWTLAAGPAYPIGTSMSARGLNTGGSMSGLVTASSSTSITLNVTSFSNAGLEGSWDITRVDYEVIAIDLKKLAADGSPNASNSYIGTLATPLSPGFNIVIPDWVGISDTDSVTGKHYIFFAATPIGVVLSVGASNIGTGLATLEYVLPEAPNHSPNYVNNGDQLCETLESCLNLHHSSLFKDWDGQIKLFGGVANAYGDFNYITTLRLSAGLQMARKTEEGGGQQIEGLFYQDIQPGCSSLVHFCGYGLDPVYNRFYSQASGPPVVAGANVTIPLTALDISGNWPSSGSIPVYGQNATAPWTCLNGKFTGTTSSGGTVLSVPAGVACGAASGSINPEFLIGDASTDNTTWSAVPIQDLNQSMMWKAGKQVHKVSQHRGVSWLNNGGGDGAPLSQYQTQLKCGMSRKGDYQACNSDWGSLDYTVGSNSPSSVYSISTGLGLPTITGATLQPAETSALLSYSISTGTSCDIEVSASSNFVSPVRTITDAAGPISRQTSLGTLTAATNYWWRMQCGLEVEASVYPFTTVASGTPATRTINTGIGAPTITGATKVVLEHQTDVTTGAWTAVASVPCATGGSGCTVSWAADIGHVNWQRFRFQNVSSVDLVVTAPTAINASR